MEKPDKQKRRGKKAAKIVLFSLLAVIAALAFVVIKFLTDINDPASLFNEPDAFVPSITAAPQSSPSPKAPSAPEATQTPEPTPTVDPVTALTPLSDLEFMKNKVNILVLGVDESAERESWGSFRTDTMILVTVDFEANSVHMLSIPRDSLVKIYNGLGELVSAKTGEPLPPDAVFPYAKINSAFSAGGGAKKDGYAYVLSTVSKTLGNIPVQYYVSFNMSVVKEVVNAMGGVDYDVDVEVTMNGRKLYPGFQHLDGQAVLDYSRQRKGSSDLARIDRQQRILMAIFAQLKSTGQIANIPAIYKAVEKNVQTNLSFAQISSLALIGARMDFSLLTRSTIPNQPRYVHGLSCVLIKTEELTEFLKKLLSAKKLELDAELDMAYIDALIAAEQAPPEALDPLEPALYVYDTNGNVVGVIGDDGMIQPLVPAG